MSVEVLWSTKETGTVAAEVEMPLELGKSADNAGGDAIAFPWREAKGFCHARQLDAAM
jgi:hypothetical protein